MAKNSNAAVNDLFGGKPVPKGKAKKTADRESVDFPKELQVAADVVAAGRHIADDIKEKMSIAEKRCKRYAMRWWAEQYLATGKRPDMARFHGLKGSFDFVQTRRMTVTAEKTEALEAMGLDISEYLETSGMKINIAAIERLGLMDKLKKALSSIVSDPEQVAQVFEPIVTPKEELLEALPNMVKAAGGGSEQLVAVLEVLEPVAQIKKPEHPGTPEEHFQVVFGAKL